MSVLAGVRAANRAFFENTNRDLPKIVLNTWDFAWLLTELGAGDVDCVEIDGVLVLPEGAER